MSESTRKTKLKKLSYPQQYALQHLKTDAWIRAWDIPSKSTTMIALEKMGLVERKQIVDRIRGYDDTDYAWRKILANNSLPAG